MEILNLGEIDYKEALAIQHELVEKLKSAPSSNEKIIVCSHNPVVTLGKKTQPQDLLGWDGPVHEIKRGGRATYHGPGQVVVYPIINIKNRNCDIGGYLRKLELSVVSTLKEFDIESRGEEERTGVWVGNQKVASIGIAIKRWITYHGMAFNLFRDPNAFQGINPCGFNTQVMTSLEDILDQKISRNHFEKKLTTHLTQLLNIDTWSSPLNAPVSGEDSLRFPLSY